MINNQECICVKEDGCPGAHSFKKSWATHPYDQIAVEKREKMGTKGGIEYRERQLMLQLSPSDPVTYMFCGMSLSLGLVGENQQKVLFY
eukprot:579277-Ditylum_brightwellii.AAC.1